MPSKDKNTAADVMPPATGDSLPPTEQGNAATGGPEASGSNGTSEPTAPAEKKARLKKPDATILGIRTDVAMPTRAGRRGTRSKYDFDKLEVGQSIGVIGRKAGELASTLSSAMRKYAKPKRNEDGTVVYKMKDGVATNEQELENTRIFFAADCDPTGDPEGATCRIWRSQ